MNRKENLFDILYDNGGYFGDASTRKVLQSELNENITLERILFNQSSIYRELGNLSCTDVEFLEKIKTHCENINIIFKDCAKSVVFKINKCIIKDEIIYVKQGDKLQAFYPSLRENEVAHSNAAAYILDKDIKPIKIDNKHRIIYYLGHVGGNNYGHWLIDVLPKIKALIETQSPICVLLQSYGLIDQRKIETIKYLCKGYDIKIKFTPKNKALECENIMYVSPISYHPYVKNTNAISYLRELFNITRRDKVCHFEKLFILRQKKHKRQIANFNQLLPILKEHNFKIIDPENMSFAKQANYFSNAKIIIGTMGAAMCNTLFSPSTAKLLYLSPIDWMEPFYWDLASCIGQEYNVIYGTRRKNIAAAHIDDFTIDSVCFERTIRHMLQKIS